MTEKEALEISKHCLGVQAEQEVCEECPVYHIGHCGCKEVSQYAIKALKKAQEYQKLEEELQEIYGDCEDFLPKITKIIIERKNDICPEEIKKARILTNEDAEKWEAYKKIGTVEECREAVEKQNKKKPIFKQGSEGGYTDTYRCPNCDGVFTATGIDDYCYRCGQKIDWKEEEHMESQVIPEDYKENLMRKFTEVV